MQPPLSWRWLLVIMVIVVAGVLWWPRPPQASSDASPNCREDTVYVQALLRDRATKDSLFRVLPESPLPAESRSVFTGLHYYAVSPAWCLRGRYEALPNALLPVVGRLHLNLPTLDSCQKLSLLTVYGDARGKNPYVAFWDCTAVLKETYEGGRYVPVFVEGDSAVIDFNRAYFPYCAYNPRYICQPYPPNNRFCVHIRAGERYASPMLFP